jgi:N-acetylmuramoyl-L-alanine amidase
VRARALRVAAVALFVSGALGAGRPDGLGDLVSVRHWSFRDYSRVVVETSAPVAVRSGEAPADRRAGKPVRLYFDLPGVWAGRRFARPLPVTDGLLRQVRIGQNTLDTARVVLDLERYGRHRLRELASPSRLVIDLFSREAGGRGAAGALPMELRPVRVVVVDAGHGGRDPGAVGADGLREKDVTLALARSLARRLRGAGFEVVPTRSRDVALSLEERTAIAEGAGGDVFVSLHANAALHAEAAGVELFTLDQDAEQQTLRLAARENGVAPASVDPLQRTLATLRLAESGARSSALAEHVYRAIAAGGASGPSLREEALKRGPFHVLYLSDMPAVLVEAGFVTSPEDARRLRDAAYLDALAGEITAGVERFRDASEALVAERRP